MFVLYAYNNGKWTEFCSFADKYDYAAQVSSAVAKKKTATTDEMKNSAIVMESFVLGKQFYGKQYGKLVMRALRHFDEVGLSNDIQASLEELLDEGCEKFALVRPSEKPEDYTEGGFEVRI
ncbi:MAG: hypothetical protein IJZ32_00715 [Clostridia bacterium]|nr:hypothetical protein [Clostridia bacterium]